MVQTDEDIWYFKHSGFYRVPECLPGDLVDILNSVTDRQIAEMIEPVVWERNGKRCAEDVRRLSKVLSRDSAYLKSWLSSHNSGGIGRDLGSKHRTAHE